MLGLMLNRDGEDDDDDDDVMVVGGTVHVH
jgi:hypothetical protein